MKTCEDCKWYHFIDSAWGRCLRFPPRWLTKPNKGLTKGWVKCKYPEVTFDNQKCGEFKGVVKKREE